MPKNQMSPSAPRRFLEIFFCKVTGGLHSHEMDLLPVFTRFLKSRSPIPIIGLWYRKYRGPKRLHDIMKYSRLPRNEMAKDTYKKAMAEL